MGAVVAGFYHHQAAVGQLLVDVIAHSEGRNNVVRRLQGERGDGRKPSSVRVSEKNVTRTKCLAMAGLVRIKLLVSSSTNSGRSLLPVITGAELRDQPL